MKVPCVLFVILLASDVLSYDNENYEILRVTAKDASQVDELLQLETMEAIEDVVISKTGTVDFIVREEKAGGVKQLLKNKFGLTIQLLAKGNVKEALKSVSGSEDSVFSYTAYHRLGTIYNYLEAIAAQHPDIVEVFTLSGNTYEGREIKAIKISQNVSNSDSKSLLWIDGGIHAREWISPATVMYIIDALVGNHETQLAPKIVPLLEKYQFVIAPCINPDGYEFTHTTKRLWRKTRKPSGCEGGEENIYGGCFTKNCWGVDPNRNWDADWGKHGVSSNPCSLVYPGSEAFDQLNTAAVRDQLLQYKGRIQLYVTYHSYSQLFLLPLGYTMEPPPDHGHHTTVGKAVVAAIKERYGTEFTSMISAGLYPASGDSADWAYHSLSISDAYTFELRDTGKHGFVLPPEQIVESGGENVDGLLALIDNLATDNN